MLFSTTTLGSYPKPSYLPIPDWFGTIGSDNFLLQYQRFQEKRDSGACDSMERLLTRATREILRVQWDAGIDIVTDGEVARDDYIYAFCRGLGGVTFSRRRTRVMRAGTWEAAVPVIEGMLEHNGSIFRQDFERAAQLSPSPVKVTLPGPLTTADTLYDECYGRQDDVCRALAQCLLREIESLVAAGCRYIQIDDPVSMRTPRAALDYGLPILHDLLTSVSNKVDVTVHLCCGYPDILDNPTFKRAPDLTYFDLARSLDNLPCTTIAIEDARCQNDLTLLRHFPKKKIALGVVSVTSSQVEREEAIVARVEAALQHIEKEKLLLAPDCGMGMLPAAIAREKLRVLGRTAQVLRTKF